MKVTPLGSVPLSLSVGVGVPVAVTVKVPAVPTTNEVLVALVMAADWFTVSVKLCVGAPAVFVAFRVIGYEPPVPAAGVPLNNPAVLSVTPLGSVPVSVNVGAGYPLAVAWNEPAVPTVNVVLVPLVKAGT